MRKRRTTCRATTACTSVVPYTSKCTLLSTHATLHARIETQTPHLPPRYPQGDSVVIGETEFSWSDDQSDGAVYDSWVKDMKDRGVNRQGSARWPHPDVR